MTKTTEIQRILVLVLKRIGEILLTTPAIRALRKAYPGAEITAVVYRPFKDVLEGNPNIDQLIVLEPDAGNYAFIRQAWRLRQKRFDLVLDFLALPSSALITLMSDAPIRVGLPRRHRKYAYNRYIPYEMGNTPYAADRRLNAVRMLGLPDDGIAMDFSIDENSAARGDELLDRNGLGAGDRFAVVAPLAGQAWKLWPFERYAQVADYLADEHSLPVVLICGPGEYHYVEQVLRHTRSTPAAAIEFTDLNIMARVLSRALFYVGNDGGVKHLASAVGTPTVTIFGPAYAHKWNEPDDPLHQMLWQEIDCRGRRCFRECSRNYECLTMISAEDTCSGIDRLLTAIKARVNAAPG
ncbi:MAG: glycosyltransferase family 9 protein [Candidatus Marinimicrobia bacterium]|nr:glycosyltransferase family 9 protein [Candidatus Neomarinimicrobiota bacterium]